MVAMIALSQFTTDSYGKTALVTTAVSSRLTYEIDFIHTGHIIPQR